MLYRLVNESWKIVAIAAAGIAGHAFWFAACRDATVFQRLGAFLIVLGVVTAARGFLREGLQAAVQRSMPRSRGTFLRSEDTGAKERAHMEKIRPQVEKDVRAERVWAVWLIGVGTAVNGYGDLPFRWLGLAS